MAKSFSDLDRARLDAILEEYRKINSGIDERVKMVDTLNNISLLVTAGYLTAIGLFNNTSTVEVNGIIAFGVILMQFFVILQILRSDYLMLNLVEYYYIDMRQRIEKLLYAEELAIWGYEHYKFNNFSENKFDKIQFNLLALMRYAIPFFSCILIGFHFILENNNDFKNNIVFIALLFIATLILTALLFVIMIRWAFFSLKKSKVLIQTKNNIK